MFVFQKFFNFVQSSLRILDVRSNLCVDIKHVLVINFTRGVYVLCNHNFIISVSMSHVTDNFQLFNTLRGKMPVWNSTYSNQLMSVDIVWALYHKLYTLLHTMVLSFMMLSGVFVLALWHWPTCGVEIKGNYFKKW